MKQLISLVLFPASLLFSLYAGSQMSIRKTSTPPVMVKENNSGPEHQVVQPPSSNQTIQSASYQQTGVTTKYYSVDQTAFSCSWGSFEIRKLYAEGAYLYSPATYGTAPYLVAPVNIPHNATITSMKVIFYDASARPTCGPYYGRVVPISAARTVLTLDKLSRNTVADLYCKP